MSTPTTPRGAQPIAFSTMIVFCSAVNVRSIIRIRPARTCGYSRLARSRPRIGDRDEAVELPEVLHRERDALLVREAPEDVRGNRPAEVGVQLGESFHEESLERAPLLLTYDARVRALLLVVVALVAAGAANAAVPTPDPVKAG